MCTSLGGTCDPRCRHNEHHNSRPSLWVHLVHHLDSVTRVTRVVYSTSMRFGQCRSWRHGSRSMSCCKPCSDKAACHLSSRTRLCHEGNGILSSSKASPVRSRTTTISKQVGVKPITTKARVKNTVRFSFVASDGCCTSP